MIILDSCVWIAYLGKNDFHHEKAVEAFDSFVDFGIIITNNILDEICGVLLRKFGESGAIYIRKFIEFVIENQNIKLMNDDLHESVSFFIKTDLTISFTDVSIIYQSLKHNAKLITFDKLLYKQYLNLQKNNLTPN